METADIQLHISTTKNWTVNLLKNGQKIIFAIVCLYSM